MFNRKKAIRKSFRDAVFKRDKNKCKVCGAKELTIDAHHIINRELCKDGGYTIDNGITLCYNCHLKAESFFQNSGGDHNYSPANLLKLIKSDRRS